jgi:hypothetical protein
MTEAERKAVADFMARKGVTRVAEGVGAYGDLKARDWYKRSRMTREELAQADSYDTPMQERIVTVDSAGRAHTVNEFGEYTGSHYL